MKKKHLKISVIIPAYHSFDTLADCLKGLKSQRFCDFEVIVVNSSQENKTRRISSKTLPEVLFIQSPVRLFPHHARNVGIEKAKGELFVFTDPDCIAQKDWLEKIWNTYQNGHNVVVGSMGVQARTRLELGIHVCKYFSYLPGLPARVKWIAPTANAAYARTVFKATGLFLEKNFIGDAVQSWKAAELGFPAWFEPGARVDHFHRQSFSAFSRERFLRGQDFAWERVVYEKWSRFKTLCMILLFPWLPWLILLRTLRSTAKAGWVNIFWATFLIQMAGQILWCLGEGVTHIQYLFRYIYQSKHRL